MFKFLGQNNSQIITPLFGELFPLKLGFWGLESSWEKNLLYSLLCVADHIAFFFWNALPSHEEVNCVTGLVTPRRQSLTCVEVQLQFVKARQGVLQWSYVVSCGLDHNRHSLVTTGQQSCVYEATACEVSSTSDRAAPSSPLLIYSIKSTMDDGVSAFVYFTKYPLARCSFTNR